VPSHPFVYRVSFLLASLSLSLSFSFSPLDELIELSRLWYPTVQFTRKIYNPNTKETIWRSINVTNFVTPPPGLDKRSFKADQLSVTFKFSADLTHPELYTIHANLSDDLQVV